MNLYFYIWLFILLIYNRFITDKASANLALLKIFQRTYKKDFNIDIYNIECVAHTLNNMVFDILKSVLCSKKDNILILNTINENQIDDDINTNSQQDILFFFLLFYFYIVK